MIKYLLSILFITSLFTIVSCGQKKSDPNAKPEDKEPSELTIDDIYEISLASENGGGSPYQGQEIGKNATGELSIYADGECGGEDCGILLVLENKNSRKSITAVIKAKFKLPNNPINKITRMYNLTPHEVVSIGCSHICHKGNSYMIQREIISADYISNSDVSTETKTDSSD
jgi:hypothetical protein